MNEMIILGTPFMDRQAKEQRDPLSRKPLSDQERKKSWVRKISDSTTSDREENRLDFHANTFQEY